MKRNIGGFKLPYNPTFLERQFDRVIGGFFTTIFIGFFILGLWWLATNLLILFLVLLGIVFCWFIGLVTEEFI